MANDRFIKLKAFISAALERLRTLPLAAAQSRCPRWLRAAARGAQCEPRAASGGSPSGSDTIAPRSPAPLFALLLRSACRQALYSLSLIKTLRAIVLKLVLPIVVKERTQTRLEESGAGTAPGAAAGLALGSVLVLFSAFLPLKRLQ